MIQLNNLSERADVAHMITGDVRPFPYWEDTFKTEEEMIVSLFGGKGAAAAVVLLLLLARID